MISGFVSRIAVFFAVVLSLATLGCSSENPVPRLDLKLPTTIPVTGNDLRFRISVVNPLPHALEVPAGSQVIVRLSSMETKSNVKDYRFTLERKYDVKPESAIDLDGIVITLPEPGDYRVYCECHVDTESRNGRVLASNYTHIGIEPGVIWDGPENTLMLKSK